MGERFYFLSLWKGHGGNCCLGSGEAMLTAIPRIRPGEKPCGKFG